ncbi:uncharacterized protein LOC122028032 isoform X1 [Zingiber officinale]|uniref:uncharacterized protein LOC122028032 isoform X1 n=1 Tax=Zingiber officinale TaxID=94328 RepID=UPI001C4B1364|nr:uncharacterized protein LOC122028032 isoform X1 [Zingiber officinale]
MQNNPIAAPTLSDSAANLIDSDKKFWGRHGFGGCVLLHKHLLLAFMGCCLGLLAETRSSSERTLKSPLKRDQSLIGWGSQWSSSSREMENNVNNISLLDTHRPSTPISACKDIKAAVINTNNHSFVNQGAITWNEMRREWLGDSSNRWRRRSEPSISWLSTYDDLLSTTQPFPQAIPLWEMVDFLVDIWHEEGLYD